MMSADEAAQLSLSACAGSTEALQKNAQYYFGSSGLIRTECPELIRTGSHLLLHEGEPQALDPAVFLDQNQHLGASEAGAAEFSGAPAEDDCRSICRRSLIGSSAPSVAEVYS